MVEQSKKLQNVNYAIRGPVLDAAYALEAKGEKILKLNIGNPGVFGFDMNSHISEAISQNLLGTGGGQSYSNSKGIVEAREVIAKYHTDARIKGVTAEDIFMEYPTFEKEDISACLRFAADLMNRNYMIKPVA